MHVIQTRTRKTEQAYLNKANQLIQRANSELGPSGNEISASQFVKWLVSNKPNWSKATWRQYIAACSNAFGDCFTNELAKHDLPPSKKCSDQTSALKIKKLPPEDLERLVIHLEQKSAKAKSRSDVPSAAFAAMLLTCGTLTGLRPIEWANASIQVSPDRSFFRVCVQNAKNTNGRAHGKARSIPMENQCDDLLSSIEILIGYVQLLQKTDVFERKVGSARRALCNANKELWPRRKKRYTLYSARHQAAANWKQFLLLEEIAALMGHFSSKTASTHYGRRSAGRSKILPGPYPAICPFPNPAEVARVKVPTKNIAHANVGPLDR